MTNIKDIAKMAGVSVTTVSRVLNNHPYVSKEKEAAVRRAIEEGNYQRNINAVHLSKGKTQLVGVVVPFLNHPYFGMLVEGIANEAVAHNFKLVLIQTNYQENREIEALQMLKLKQIDALIICSRICEWEIVEEYISYGPIAVCEEAGGRSVSSTYIDHYKSFTKALTYLHEQGHVKIGYCLGRRSGDNSRQREGAYRDFMKNMKLPLVQGYIFHDCFNLEDGEKVVQELMRMKDPPTALLVASDQVAAGILACCNDNSIGVPDKLALMGFDNQPISRMMNITTLHIPLKEIGKKLFLQAINGNEVSHEEMSVTLIKRLSV